MRPELRLKIQEGVEACSTLINLMQSDDPTIKEEATDAARGMLWKWVDEGNTTELLNLIGAIRLVSQMSLQNWEDK